MIALNLHNCTTQEIYEHFLTVKSAKQIVCRTATVSYWGSYRRQHHKCVGRIKSFLIKINHNSHSVPQSLKQPSKALSAANLAFSLKNEYQIKREPTAGPEPKRKLSGTKIAENNVCSVLRNFFTYNSVQTRPAYLVTCLKIYIYDGGYHLLKGETNCRLMPFYASCKENDSWSNAIQHKEQGFFQKVTL